MDLFLPFFETLIFPDVISLKYESIRPSFLNSWHCLSISRSNAVRFNITRKSIAGLALVRVFKHCWKNELCPLATNSAITPLPRRWMLAGKENIFISILLNFYESDIQLQIYYVLWGISECRTKSKLHRIPKINCMIKETQQIQEYKFIQEFLS